MRRIISTPTNQELQNVNKSLKKNFSTVRHKLEKCYIGIYDLKETEDNNDFIQMESLLKNQVEVDCSEKAISDLYKIIK